MKHYRNLNGCVSRMHRVIYEAYDKGYEQAKKDFKREQCSWETVPQQRYTGFRCDNCKNYAIAKYTFCPHCGSPMTEDAYGTDKT